MNIRNAKHAFCVFFLCSMTLFGAHAYAGTAHSDILITKDIPGMGPGWALTGYPVSNLKQLEQFLSGYDPQGVIVGCVGKTDTLPYKDGTRPDGKRGTALAWRRTAYCVREVESIGYRAVADGVQVNANIRGAELVVRKMPQVIERPMPPTHTTKHSARSSDEFGLYGAYGSGGTGGAGALFQFRNNHLVDAGVMFNGNSDTTFHLAVGRALREYAWFSNCAVCSDVFWQAGGLWETNGADHRDRLGADLGLLVKYPVTQSLFVMLEGGGIFYKQWNKEVVGPATLSISGMRETSTTADIQEPSQKLGTSGYLRIGFGFRF